MVANTKDPNSLGPILSAINICAAPDTSAATPTVAVREIATWSDMIVLRLCNGVFLHRVTSIAY